MRWHREDEFTHKGLPCVCLANSAGFRAGYVGVPANHPFYSLSEFEIPDYDVHCGIDVSFLGAGEFLSEGYWWFGFHTDHLGDKIDMSILEDEERLSFSRMYGAVRDVNFVEAECRKLAVYLSEVEE